MVDIENLNSFIRDIKSSIADDYYPKVKSIIKFIVEELYSKLNNLPERKETTDAGLTIIMSTEELISLVADFLKTIDAEMANDFIKIVLGQNSDIGIKMYNYDSLTDSQKLEKDKMWQDVRYPKFGRTFNCGNRRESVVPLGLEIKSKKVTRVWNMNGKGTLFDAIILLHEFIHTRDKIGKQRKWLAEIPTYCFEKMFEMYLLQRMPYKKGSIRRLEEIRIAGVINDIDQYQIIIELLELFENSGGNITQADFDKYIDETWEDREIAEEMINETILGSRDFNFGLRYILGLLAYPHFIELYCTDREKALIKIKEFIASIGNQNIEESLAILDIDFSYEGISNSIYFLIEDINKIIAELNDEEGIRGIEY